MQWLRLYIKAKTAGFFPSLISITPRVGNTKKKQTTLMCSHSLRTVSSPKEFVMSVTGVSLPGFMFFVYAHSFSQPTEFVNQTKESKDKFSKQTLERERIKNKSQYYNTYPS